jgi:hypothetical protein
MPCPTASIAIPEELARQMPSDPTEQQEVVTLDSGNGGFAELSRVIGEAKDRSLMRLVRPGSPSAR